MKIVIDIPDEAKEAFDKASKNELYSTCYYDYKSVIGTAIQNGTPLEKVLEDIKAEIEEEIKHWELRKPPIEETKVGYTSCVNSEHSTKIRNPKEIEYIRYAERIGGLDMALEIIDKHTSVEDNK